MIWDLFSRMSLGPKSELSSYGTQKKHSQNEIGIQTWNLTASNKFCLRHPVISGWATCGFSSFREPFPKRSLPSLYRAKHGPLGGIWAPKPVLLIFGLPNGAPPGSRGRGRGRVYLGVTTVSAEAPGTDLDLNELIHTVKVNK